MLTGRDKHKLILKQNAFEQLELLLFIATARVQNLALRQTVQFFLFAPSKEMRKNNSNYTLLLPSMYFLIHYAIINLLLNAINSELLTS
jgi:hypothetical protein